MDAIGFDRLARTLAAPTARRGIGRLLLTVPLAATLAALVDEASEAARRRHNTQQRRSHRRAQIHEQRKKKKKCAKAGQTTSKKRKKCCQGLSKDGSGVCAAACTPATCDATVCGSVPDGCGGTLSCGGCAGNSLCDAGVCQPCTVTCVSGIPTVCGADLQLALAAGGTVYVCPGRYQENFTLDAAVRVIGAGEGAGVATDTILTANGLGRVLQINAGVGLVALERLRLTGGSADSGGGIFHQGTTLRMTECTVSGNTVNGFGGGIAAGLPTTLEMTRCTVRDNEAIAVSGSGGGIYSDGTTTLTDCLIEDNRAEGTGGQGGGLALIFGTATLTGSTRVRGNAASLGAGIYYAGKPSSTLVIAETCRVTENTADAGQGGGIYNSLGSVILQGADPSPIMVNNCEENCAGDPVPKCSTAPPVSC